MSTSSWTMKDVQVHLHSILMADHPLSQDQRKSLKAVIEMCDVWNRISPGFQKVVKEFREKGILPDTQECPSTCRTVTKQVNDNYCLTCRAKQASALSR